MSYSTFTSKSVGAVFVEFNSGEAGLTAIEAERRLQKHGPNQVAAEAVRWWQILGRQFNTPFIFLLLAAATLSFIMKEITDGIMVIVFVAVNAVLGFIQEYHSQKSLELLKKYVVAEARVRRSGKETLIPAVNIVPGDVIIIEAGDIIPADIRFFNCNDLMINESVLTGESAPIEKTSSELKNTATAFHNAKNIGFSGTTVASGKGVGVVFATGRATAMGDISRLTVETHHTSAFEKGISKFSKFILRMILVVLVLLFGANLLIKGSSTNIFELALFSIALAVSVVPEALPVVTTIALSRGAVQLARRHVVVKRLSAVEDLGSIEILCTDKTGTLTENKLTVREVNAVDSKKCLFLATLASPFLGERVREPNNAFDIALWDTISPEEKNKFKQYVKVVEIPFDPERRRNSVLIKNAHRSELIVRGAPEVLFKLCGLLKTEQMQYAKWMESEGKLGRRVIAIGVKEFHKEKYSPSDERSLKWVGIISFEDPIKSTAPAALEKAGKLGLTVKILTGDSKEVAAAVGTSVGLIKHQGEVVTGEDIERLKDVDSQVALVEKTSVFARVSPQQKYNIIELLQTKHEVGFLGEGINDAPALKMADVGIVVADASDIARDAADIVLLKKSLTVIVEGIHEGREIFANTVKYIKTTLISNFGNFYAIAVASLLIPYLPMLPVQILLLNLLSDFPMIAIATDTVDAEELRRPRSYNVKEIVLLAVVLGTVSTVFDFVFFAIFRSLGSGSLQTNWFIGSVLTELVLIFSVRTSRFFIFGKRPAAVLSLLCVVAFVVAIVLPFIPLTQRAFSFIRPRFSDILLLLAIVGTYFMVNEILKVIYYRYMRPSTN